MSQSKYNIFHFKNFHFKKISCWNLGFFFGLPIHFGVCVSAHCAYARLSFGSRIARSQRYVYACMDYIITLNVSFIIIAHIAHVILPKNALIYVHFCMLFAGLIASNFSVTILLTKNIAMKVFACLHEILNNI